MRRWHRKLTIEQLVRARSERIQELETELTAYQQKCVRLQHALAASRTREAPQPRPTVELALVSEWLEETEPTRVVTTAEVAQKALGKANPTRGDLTCIGRILRRHGWRCSRPRAGGRVRVYRRGDDVGPVGPHGKGGIGTDRG
jgi:predicted transcriptional regulator